MRLSFQMDQILKASPGKIYYQSGEHIANIEYIRRLENDQRPKRDKRKKINFVKSHRQSVEKSIQCD